jgi:hypothetical protein
LPISAIFHTPSFASSELIGHFFPKRRWKRKKKEKKKRRKKKEEKKEEEAGRGFVGSVQE